MTTTRVICGHEFRLERRRRYIAIREREEWDRIEVLDAESGDAVANLNLPSRAAAEAFLAEFNVRPFIGRTW